VEHTWNVHEIPDFDVRITHGDPAGHFRPGFSDCENAFFYIPTNSVDHGRGMHKPQGEAVQTDEQNMIDQANG